MTEKACWGGPSLLLHELPNQERKEIKNVELFIFKLWLISMLMTQSSKWYIRSSLAGGWGENINSHSSYN